jgi:hypothetical protein
MIGEQQANISEAQLRSEAPKAQRLLDDEYFQITVREMELAAMEQAIVGPTEDMRTAARIEVLMLRKMLGYLQVTAGAIKDLDAARQHMKAME